MSRLENQSSEPKSCRAPGPHTTSLLGHARPFQRDPLGFLLGAATDFGGVVRLKLGPLTYHLVSDPALVLLVLKDRAANYVRDTRSSRSVRLLTGESLLTSEGPTWRRHRQLAQPIFHQQRVRELAETMAATADELAKSWSEAARTGRTLDLAAEMSRITFTVAGRCLFGTELDRETNVVAAVFPELLEELFRRAQAIASWPMWLPLPRHRAFLRGRAAIDDVVTRIISGRRAQGRDGTDLLGSLLAARTYDGSALSDAEIRDQVVTFLLAGHETTASTLTWALSLLAHAPDEREKVERELDEEKYDSSRPLAVSAMSRLPRLQAVLQETLRLYPAIWIAERRVVARDVLGGFFIPKNSSVVVAPYVTHRLPSLWSQPNQFIPDRFFGRDSPVEVEAGFFPFGTGPHVCIGQHFALMEMKIILATLLSRFRLRPIDAGLPTPLAGITLRPLASVPVRVENRRVGGN